MVCLFVFLLKSEGVINSQFLNYNLVAFEFFFSNAVPMYMYVYNNMLVRQ